MKRRAFTLIELIVVISVIGLLIAIAVPSLARARFVAKRTACLTHVRGLSHALNLYMAEWNAPIPIVMTYRR